MATTSLYAPHVLHKATQVYALRFLLPCMLYHLEHIGAWVHGHIHVHGT